MKRLWIATAAHGLHATVSGVMWSAIIALFVVLDYFGPRAAFACQARQFERTLLFEERDIADGVDAPFIADVTIESIALGPDDKLVARARVQKWIKGAIEGNEIIIATVPSSCDRGFVAGARGIVAGALVSNAKGVREIAPIFETFVDRDRRRLRSAAPSRQ